MVTGSTSHGPGALEHPPRRQAPVTSQILDRRTVSIGWRARRLQAIVAFDTVLRFWEQGGRGGPIATTLPGRFATTEPVDLRGGGIGHPIAIEKGELRFDLGAYAPASFLLRKRPRPGPVLDAGPRPATIGPRNLDGERPPGGRPGRSRPAQS